MANGNNRRRTRRKAPANKAKAKVSWYPGRRGNRHVFAFEIRARNRCYRRGLKISRRRYAGRRHSHSRYKLLGGESGQGLCHLLTHGREDHIGGLPYILKQLRKPVCGTKLTLGLLEETEEKVCWRIAISRKFTRHAPAGKREYRAEFSGLTQYSRCGGHLFAPPAGLIVHSGDFKIDHTPVDGKVMDFTAWPSMERKGASSPHRSTNAEREGYTQSRPSWKPFPKSCAFRIVGLSWLPCFQRAPHSTGNQRGN